MAEACPNDQRKQANQDARIFSPVLRDSLVSIINKIDPPSFVKLARTCRTMHDLCFSDKRIAVSCGVIAAMAYSLPVNERTHVKRLNIEIVDDPSKPENIRVDLIDHDLRLYGVNPVPEELLQRVLAMPFRFVIDSVSFSTENEANARQMQTLVDYLHRFHRVDVHSVDINYGTSDWNMVVDLVQEFRVREFSIFSCASTPIPEDLLRLLTINLDTFTCRDYVSDDVVLATIAKSADFFWASISVETFKILLQRFVTGQINDYWLCGREVFDGDDAFSDPFVKACSEVMKVVHVDDITTVIKDPGILYCGIDEPRMLYLERIDGSNASFEVDQDSVIFY